MNSIELMMEEHRNIKRMLQVLRAASNEILQGKEIDYEDFAQMIDFVRGYADAHHHGKEEEMFFNRMVEELGPAAQKLVVHGMLVEHDLGRLHMAELEAALDRVKGGDEEAKLDVIANAVGYTHLLHRHIDKEDAVVFPFAERGFKEDILSEINKAYQKYEDEKADQKLQEKYLTILDGLERKYKI